MKRRLFIGIDFSPAIKARLDQWIQQVSQQETRIVWEQKDNVHLTLKFLGQTDISFELILAALEKKLHEVSRFSLRLGNVGFFADHGTIVFIDVEKTEELLTLYHMINNEMETLGFTRERKAYHPHITIGRSKDFYFPKDLNTAQKPLGSVSPVAREVVVFETKTGTLGKRYITLGKITLSKMVMV